MQVTIASICGHATFVNQWVTDADGTPEDVVHFRDIDVDSMPVNDVYMYCRDIDVVSVPGDDVYMCCRDTDVVGVPGDDVYMYCRDIDVVGVPGDDVYPGRGRLVDGRPLFVVLPVTAPGLCLRHDAALHGAVPLHQAHRCDRPVYIR